VSDFCCVPLSCRNETSKSLYEEAVLGILGWAGTRHPTIPLLSSLEQDPNFVMAKALLGLYDDKYVENHKELALSAKTKREQKHIEAVGHLSKSRFRAAAQIYEEILLDHPSGMRIFALQIVLEIPLLFL
jgi:hypothetical protein